MSSATAAPVTTAAALIGALRRVVAVFGAWRIKLLLLWRVVMLLLGCVVTLLLPKLVSTAITAIPAKALP
jgi:hypothetical protein